MDIPRLLHMNNYWNENPPIHLLIKAYMGIENKKENSQKNSSNLASIISEFPQQTETNKKINVRMIN